MGMQVIVTIIFYARNCGVFFVKKTEKGIKDDDNAPTQ